MKTKSAVQSVIRFLEGSEASLHEIATAINMDPRLCSNLLGAMMRAGTLNRVGNMRSYVYSLSANFINPEQIYLERVQLVHLKLKEHGRLTLKDIKALLSETEWTARAFIDEALKNGDIYKHGKQGYFLSFGDYEKHIENATEKRLVKRRALGAAYRETCKASRKKMLKQAPDEVRPVEINIVCEECRQNWQGYQVHKIFGSGARA